MTSTRNYSRGFFGAILIFFCFADTVLSQNNRVENFIKAGPQDAEALTRAYLKPYPSGIGASLNTGWFNTATTHKFLGFDLQIRGAMAVVPSYDRAFNVEDIDFERIQIVEGEPSLSPTGAGSSEKGPWVSVRDNGQQVARFNLPQGSGFSYVPAPLIQGSVGLIKNTDLTVRFIPEIKMGDYVDFRMVGMGIKHSLNQWLPTDNLLPVDISVFAGFNHADLTGYFDMNPPQPDPTTNYENQRVYINFDTFSAKLLVGKEWGYVSLFGALGYETSSMDLDVTGNYPVPVRGPGGTVMTETITDPFSYREEGKNKYSGTAGVTFNLSFARIFAEYTLAKYPVGSAGIGFSFR